MIWFGRLPPPRCHWTRRLVMLAAKLIPADLKVFLVPGWRFAHTQLSRPSLEPTAGGFRILDRGCHGNERKLDPDAVPSENLDAPPAWPHESSLLIGDPVAAATGFERHCRMPRERDSTDTAALRAWKPDDFYLSPSGARRIRSPSGPEQYRYSLRRARHRQSTEPSIQLWSCRRRKTRPEDFQTLRAR